MSRAQNLDDLLAAYDWFVARRDVAPSAVAVVGISYGGYLASLPTALRPVRWLALRSPALYKDEGRELPKRRLHEDPDLHAFRRRPVPWQDNRALGACHGFGGDVLLVGTEHDEIVPPRVIGNYAGAFATAGSLTRRRIAGADHAFSGKPQRKAYTDVLVGWLIEMVLTAREQEAGEKVAQHKRMRRAGDMIAGR